MRTGRDVSPVQLRLDKTLRPLKANEVKRYHKKTVEQFMMYLQYIGLSVYGPSMTLEGEELPALMDYDAEHIVARRKHIDKETLWSSEDVSG